MLSYDRLTPVHLGINYFQIVLQFLPGKIVIVPQREMNDNITGRTLHM